MLIGIYIRWFLIGFLLIILYILCINTGLYLHIIYAVIIVDNEIIIII